MSYLNLGVFLPIANNGWIISKNAPHYMPTYQLNKDTSLAAEQVGFDDIFSMSKWRGYGGETQHWDHATESLTLMSALAAVTTRVRVIASLNPLLYPPGVAAKMAATIDDVSGGRFGLNIVAGTNFQEYGQMGLLPDDFGEYRYDYAEEWLTVVKRLWTEDRVTHQGRFFNYVDAVSSPKPIQQPYPSVVCAGTSDRGKTFTIDHGSDAFVVAESLEATMEHSRDVKRRAREKGKDIPTHTVLTVIQAPSDQAANEIFERYREGVDIEAMEGVFKAFGADTSGTTSQYLSQMAKESFGLVPFIVGSPQTITDQLVTLSREGEVNGALLCFDDFVKGVNTFGSEVIPLLQEQGLRYRQE